ncbi:hypothetical protein JQ543_12370 [Bradyrhizobium diazoefficiens]|nr:hypothetical protein [Bradyrhizobium diazoefficiens]MBR0848538.1 hypothetical protein [Bradyrhizobium diazoefficiens]
MRPSRLLPRSGACLAAALALAATVLVSTCPARALETRDLTGWWIAIDEVYPTLWRHGDIVAMEELLIVTPDGRATNRTMRFIGPNPVACLESGLCTDAPLIATARLALKGDLLTVRERKETTIRIDDDRVDPLIRRIAVTATPVWTVAHVDGLLVLRSATANATRAFARIAPNRLRALWAGLLSSGQSAADHWRCLLANATAADPAFVPLRGRFDKAAEFLDARASTFLEAYLRAASYDLALTAARSMVISDDPDPRLRTLKSDAVELFMATPFDDIALPRTAAERERLRARHKYLVLLARGLAPEAASRHVDVAPVLRGEQVKLAVTDAELAALGRVWKATDRPPEGADLEVRQLLCLD